MFNNVDVTRNMGYMTFHQVILSTKTVRLQAQLDTLNPNVLLASNLGLTNPAMVAWDLVPFSFVVDWFLPVGKFLNSFDSHYGFSLKHGCGAYDIKSHASLSESYVSGGFVSGFADAREYSRDQVSSFSLPRFSDRIQPLSGSLWRAATAVALGIQQLKSLR